MVNDVHRSIKTEDEYLEYSRQLHEDCGINPFILERAFETTESEKVKEILQAEIEKYKVEEETTEQEEVVENEVETEVENTIEITEAVYELDGGSAEVVVTEETANV